MACPPLRTLCLSGLLMSACAVGAALWRPWRPSEAPPPPPDLSFLQESEAPPAVQTAPLEETERERLWDIEHHGNLLNEHGFKRLAGALRDRDTATLTSLFADTFQGHLPNQPREVHLCRDPVDILRSQDSGRPPLAAGRSTFISRLLEYRKLFTSRPPSIQMVLKTLRPSSNSNKQGPWEGLALLRLYGESAPGKPCEVSVTMHYEVAQPTRERLSGTGWLYSLAIRQSQVAHASHYLLVDVVRQRGLDPSRYHDNWLHPPTSSASRWIATGGVFVCDFDRDGYLDLLITDINCYTLYRGRPGGRFEDVTRQMGLPSLPSNADSLSSAAVWIDIDGDGWEDLILGERVFRNEEGRKLVDYTARTLLALPADTLALTVADYDRDGKLDLYVTRTGSATARSWLEERSGPEAGNRLFRNRGRWQFEDVTQASHTDGGKRSTFTAIWLDANDDGWPDVYVPNEFGNGVLLVNQGDGTFRSQALGSGPTDFGTMGAAAGDVDNDGRIDIYAANMYSKAGSRIIGNLAEGTFPDDVMGRLRRFVAGSQLHLNKGGLTFDQAGERMQVHAVGWAYGPALADLDNDGWLDIFATAGQISQDRKKPDG
jgi:hypothetical protein